MDTSFFLGTTLGVVILVLAAVYALVVALLPVAAWKAAAALQGIHQAIGDASAEAARAYDSIELLHARLMDANWPVSAEYGARQQKVLASALERADWRLVTGYERHGFVTQFTLDRDPAYREARAAAWRRIKERGHVTTVPS